jgi:hypothetical protein
MEHAMTQCKCIVVPLASRKRIIANNFVRNPNSKNAIKSVVSTKLIALKEILTGPRDFPHIWSRKDVGKSSGSTP